MNGPIEPLRFHPTTSSVMTTLEYRVEGAPPLQGKYGVLFFNPRLVTLKVKDDALWSVKISGHQRKKDGSDGVNELDNEYSVGTSPWDRSDLPGWVNPIVENALYRNETVGSARP